MIKKDLFQQLKGFDEDLFMHQEEIDLCWRSQLTNYQVLFCPNSTVYHFGGGTLSYKSPIKKYYNHRNNLLILSKNLQLKYLLLVIPLRLMIDYCIIIYYLLFGILYIVFISPLYIQNIYKTDIKYGLEKIKMGFLILKAHLKYFILLPNFLKKRKEINSKLIYPGSIIFDFFIKQKQKFSDLKKF